MKKVFLSTLIFGLIIFGFTYWANAYYGDVEPTEPISPYTGAPDNPLPTATPTATPTPTPTPTPPSCSQITDRTKCGDGFCNTFPIDDPRNACVPDPVPTGNCKCKVFCSSVPAVPGYQEPACNILGVCGDFQQCKKVTLSNSCTCKTVAGCGNGAVDSGEACDPSASPDSCVASGLSCKSDCSECIAVCGDGRKGGTEQCDGPANPCPNPKQNCVNCQCVTPPGCGNGVAEPGEECGEPGLSCAIGQTCNNCKCCTKSGVKCGTLSGIDCNTTGYKSCCSGTCATRSGACFCP